jgi:1-acyl-sn-glycerol-3-phosphate acyltransferase
MICLIFLPLIILFSKDKHQRSNRMRTVIRYTFRWYLSVLEFLGVVGIKTEGLDSLQKINGKLIICNHPSLLDVVIIMSRLRNIQCLVNGKLWKNPFLSLAVRSAGYIRNDIDPQLFLEECKEILLRGENIIIFPEGTRTVPGQPIKMNRGVANLAISSGADIQALNLKCSSVWLIKDSKWYDIPPKRANFLLKVGPNFSYKNYCNDSPRSIQVRALMRDIQHYYDRN